MSNKMTINQWAEEDRPREKMMLHGVASLSNAELLAILIGSGNTEESAVDLMRKVLNNYHNNLNELGKASIDELCKYKALVRLRLSLFCLHRNWVNVGRRKRFVSGSRFLALRMCMNASIR